MNENINIMSLGQDTLSLCNKETVEMKSLLEFITFIIWNKNHSLVDLESSLSVLYIKQLILCVDVLTLWVNVASFQFLVR